MGIISIAMKQLILITKCLYYLELSNFITVFEVRHSWIHQQMYIEPVENLRDSCSVAFSCCVMKLGIKNIEKWTFALSSRCQIPR